MVSPQVRAGEIAEEVRSKEGFAALAVYDGSTAYKAFLAACKRVAALEAERDNAMSEALNSAALMLKEARREAAGEARREGARDALTCSNCNYMAKPPICTKCGCAIGEVDDEV